MKLNKQIFHDFFYVDTEAPKRYDKAKNATCYFGRHFFSYDTEIGYWHTAGGRDTLFLSDYRFSNTTAAHISALRQACPFNNVVYVPFEYDDNFSGAFIWSSTPYKENDFFGVMHKRFIEKLSAYDANDLRYAARRRELIHKYENYAALHVAGGFNAEDCGELRDIVALAEAAREIEDAGAEKRKKRIAEEKARIIENTLNLEKELAGMQIGEIARSIDAGGLPIITRKNRKLFLGCKFPGASFIWQDAGYIKTSQGVTMPVATVKTMYHAYTRDKVKIGMHVGAFTVMEITPDFVQIGCHKIPVQNIHEVCSNL